MQTTISISKDLKEKIATLGNAGESYEDVIRKMYEFMANNVIEQWLYDDTNALSINEARKMLDDEYRKS